MGIIICDKMYGDARGFPAVRTCARTVQRTVQYNELTNSKRATITFRYLWLLLSLSDFTEK